MRDGRSDATMGHDISIEAPAYGTSIPWPKGNLGKGAANNDPCRVQGKAPAHSQANRGKAPATRYVYHNI